VPVAVAARRWRGRPWPGNARRSMVVAGLRSWLAASGCAFSGRDWPTAGRVPLLLPDLGHGRPNDGRVRVCCA
jgi:hypothetical protein